MYKLFVRPILFLFDAERVHHFVFSSLKFFFKLPFSKDLVRSRYASNKNEKLKTSLFGIDFPSPVGLAAGFDKDAKLVDELSNFGFGFIEIGTATPKPQIGNPKKRLFRLKKDKALINRMGFNNSGAKAIAERLSRRKSTIIVGGNIGKNTLTTDEEAKKDYIYCFNVLHEVVDYFAVNVSCPNIGNIEKLQNKDFLLDLLHHLQRANQNYPKSKPILLKISPDLNQMQLDEVIDIIRETQIDGVIATNTTLTRDGVSVPKNELEAIGNGGLSGKPLKQRSTEVIKYLAEKSQGTFPIIGVGGIASAEDALEKLKAGASLVQVYTGFIYEGPALIKRINKAYLKYVSK